MQVLGTLNYLSPEQIEGRSVDGRRADAYSLACAAFEMLAGAPPFRRDQSLAVMWAQLSAPPPALTSARPDLPAGVDQVMFRGLATAPEDRYPNCRSFAAALQEACGVTSAELQPHAAQAAAAHGTRPRAGTGRVGGTSQRRYELAASDPAEPALGGRGQATPASPAAGFPAPPRAVPPTSADLPYGAQQGGAGLPSTERSSLTPPASPERPYLSPPSRGEPSYVPPQGSADRAYGTPPVRAGPSYVIPPAGAEPPGAWPAGQPPQRSGPPGPYRPQPPRKRRRGLAVVATGVFLLAVIAAGLAVLKHHNSQLNGGPTVASSTPATGGGVSVPVTPATVVRRYYAAISRRDYARAWKLGGDNTKTSYAQFGGSGLQPAPAGRGRPSLKLGGVDQVAAGIVAVQADGSVKKFEGTYLVRSGVITSFNVHQVG